MVNRLTILRWEFKFAKNGFLLLLFLLAPFVAYGEAETVAATVVYFSEYEQGSGSYPVKMTVTDDFLRIDDTEEGKDFVLLDRKQNIIYSVSAENLNIIQIKLQDVTIKPPFALKLKQVELDMEADAPLIVGKKARHYQFFVNDKLCYDLIAVPGLLTDAVVAMKAFKRVLAGQQADTLRSIPADLQQGCDLVNHVFYPELYLDKGFPIVENEHGKTMATEEITNSVSYSRNLINFTTEKVPAERFILPDYQVYPIN